MANTDEQGTKKPNKVMPIILGLLLILGLGFGIKEYIYYSKHEDTDDAQIDGDISPVVARVGGYVDSISFEDYQHVNQGQLLVKIDDRDYKVKLEQAQSAQKVASASVQVSQDQISTTAASSASAKAQVDAASIKLKQADRDYARYANLVKDGSITQQQFEQAQVARDAAKVALQAAQDQYKATLEQISGTRSQLNVTNTGVSQKQTDIDFAKLQLSYTNITSPASGIVSKKAIQKGQLVQPGQTLFSVVNDNSLFITANFKETQMGHLRVGEKVDIDVDGLPGEKIEGEVYEFSPATGAKFSLLPPDNATGNYVKVVQRIPVKIKINASKEVMAKLRVGMSVNVSVIFKD